MGRAPCCDKNGLKKGPWTPEEDEKLIDYIKMNGYGNWRTLPKNAGLERCGKSCRLRWTNYLRPDIKRGRFSFEEEETIIQLHSILGNKWSAIAARLPGRTDNEIKNYWNTHIRKRLLRMGIDPITHSPRLDLLNLSSILNCPQMNISRILGFQPLINPELLRVATSLFSNINNNNSSEDQKSCQNFPPQNLQEMQNCLLLPQLNQNPVQQAEIQPPTFSDQTHIMDTKFTSNIFNPQNYPTNEWQSNGTEEQSQEEYYLRLPSQDYSCGYFSDQSLLDISLSDNNADNLGFHSVLSTLSTPSSSCTPLNSNSTYNNNITEDERESYCSNMMMKFEIPDVLDVNEFYVN